MRVQNWHSLNGFVGETEIRTGMTIWRKHSTTKHNPLLSDSAIWEMIKKVVLWIVCCPQFQNIFPRQICMNWFFQGLNFNRKEKVNQRSDNLQWPKILQQNPFSEMVFLEQFSMLRGQFVEIGRTWSIPKTKAELILINLVTTRLPVSQQQRRLYLHQNNMLSIWDQSILISTIETWHLNKVSAKANDIEALRLFYRWLDR